MENEEWLWKKKRTKVEMAIYQGKIDQKKTTPQQLTLPQSGLIFMVWQASFRALS